jgi:hypothetical protein
VQGNSEGSDIAANDWLEPLLVTISSPGEVEYHQHVICLFDLDSLRQQLGCKTPEGGSIL